MKKNIVQDVIPPKKSIRNIDVPRRAQRIMDEPEEVVTPPIKETPAPKIKRSIKNTGDIKILKEKEEEVESSYKYEYDEPKKPRKLIKYAAYGFVALVVLFGISALFKSASITIIPKQEIKTLNSTFTATKDSTTGLGFQLVTITKDAEREVAATSEQKVEKKATGRIIIYNNYSTASQKLVATTRFETAEGLVYRLVNPVVIPGRTTKDGKTVAGSIEVVVEADKVGTAYNIELKDFTIPGFKGDPKYTQIYGRSKTAMTGGFSGMQKIVSKETMDTVDQELENELQASLSRDIVSQIPSNFVLYENSLSFKYEAVNQTNSPAGGAVVRKKGVASAIIFDKGTLSRVIMSKILPEAVDDVVKITNLDALAFTYIDPSFNPNTNNQVSFELKGEPQFVWVFDENKLKTDLLGLSKKSAKSVLGTYPTIKEAWVETSPFWSKTIPSNSDKVKLIITLTK